MKFVTTIFLVSVLFVVSSCKKDELKDETAILTGKWSWTQTFSVSNYCDIDTLWDIVLIDSSSSDGNYNLEFFDNGKVLFSHNGGKIWNRRIVFNAAEQQVFTTGPYSYFFQINLNNRKNDILELYVGPDSMLVHDFPKDTEDECKEYFNHFVRD